MIPAHPTETPGSFNQSCFRWVGGVVKAVVESWRFGALLLLGGGVQEGRPYSSLWQPPGFRP